MTDGSPKKPRAKGARTTRVATGTKTINARIDRLSSKLRASIGRIKDLEELILPKHRIK